MPAVSSAAKSTAMVSKKLVSQTSNKPVKKIQPAITQHQVQVAPAASEQWIQIEGSFTPKAVYKGADYASGLLMRVAPGTTFKLTNTSDKWYVVETDAGEGYVLHRDAQIIQ
jgi:predicted oxidoreductase